MLDLYKNQTKDIVIEATDNKGSTPLMVASSRGHDDDVAFLLDDAGADIGHKDIYGQTAMDYASESGNSSVVHILAQHGADMISGNVGRQWQPLMVMQGQCQPSFSWVLT